MGRAAGCGRSRPLDRDRPRTYPFDRSHLLRTTVLQLAFRSIAHEHYGALKDYEQHWLRS